MTNYETEIAENGADVWEYDDFILSNRTERDDRIFRDEDGDPYLDLSGLTKFYTSEELKMKFYDDTGTISS